MGLDTSSARRLGAVLSQMSNHQMISDHGIFLATCCPHQTLHVVKWCDGPASSEHAICFKLGHPAKSQSLLRRFPCLMNFIQSAQSSCTEAPLCPHLACLVFKAQHRKARFDMGTTNSGKSSHCFSLSHRTNVRTCLNQHWRSEVCGVETAAHRCQLKIALNCKCSVCASFICLSVSLHVT